MTAARAAPSQAQDGRHQRGARTRAAVADALLELLDEGELRPSVARVAARAGVSVRLVFHHFQDAEALFEAAAQRQLQRVLPSIVPVPVDLPFPDRLARFVTARAKLLERIAPVRRAALLLEPFSRTLAARLSEARAFKRQQALAVFAPELRALPRGRRKVAARALGACASFAAWDALRAHQGLTVAAAKGALRELISSLLGPAHPTPRNPRRGS